MQMKTLLIAVMASMATAQDLAAFSSEAIGYIQSVLGNPDIQASFISLAAASPALVSSLQAIGTNIDPQHLTIDQSLLTQLPAPFQTLFSSIGSAEASIASKYGIVPGAAATATGASATATGAVSATGSVASSISSAATSKASGASSVASSVGSAVSSAVSSAASAGSSSASAASAGASSSSSKTGNGAAPTSLPLMGVAVGAIGALAAFL